MAVLNSWQRIDRVLSGKPFGDGKDGNATISADPNTRQSCSGASAQKNLTIASGAFSNGDVVLIHQSRGTGAGQWEINKIASGGGTTTLVMQEDLHYTYTDSGASQAQVMNIPRYKNLTMNSLTVTAWNKNIGGVLIVCAKKVTIPSGQTINLAGGDGAGSIVTNQWAAGGTGGGFVGGAGRPASSLNQVYTGEGTSGDVVLQYQANGNGGGGARLGGSGAAHGGGGGNATTGATGGADGGSNGGIGGAAAGSADLTNIVFGGGGGGGAKDSGGGGNGAGGGGAGGGILFIFAETTEILGNISLNGGAGAAPATWNGIGGGGAGGSFLLATKNATLTGTVTANAGGPIVGSVGRIAIHHSGTVTGTTNPTFTDVSDPTLKEPAGGSFLYNFF